MALWLHMKIVIIFGGVSEGRIGRVGWEVAGMGARGQIIKRHTYHSLISCSQSQTEK